MTEQILKGVGNGVMLKSKNAEWILLENGTEKKTYQNAQKKGKEIQLYGIQIGDVKKDAIIEDDTLFAFKE